MIDNSLHKIAVEVAGTADVHSTPNSVVLYSVSFLPTMENKNLADAYVAANPKAMTIENTECGKRLIELGFYWDKIDNEQEKFNVAEIWKLASERFIECASGDVTAFVNGADIRSVFRSVELPNILRNKKIYTVNGEDKFNFAAGLSEAISA